MAQAEKAARMAAAWWGSWLLSGERAAFEAALYPLILADLTEHGRCCLECDYDPFGHLLTAVRAAGLRCQGSMFSAAGILPRKHSLDVTLEWLDPKEGYGNWTDRIAVEG